MSAFPTSPGLFVLLGPQQSLADLPVGSVAKGFVARKAAVAQGNAVACLEGFAIRALNGDAAGHPEWAGDGPIRGDFGGDGNLLGQVGLDVGLALLDRVGQSARGAAFDHGDGQQARLSVTGIRNELRNVRIA